MTRLDEMVAAGYEEARRAAIVTQNPSRRSWFINGREYTDRDLRDLGIDDPQGITGHQLSMLQLMSTNLVTRREAMEKMVFV